MATFAGRFSSPISTLDQPRSPRIGFSPTELALISFAVCLIVFCFFFVYFVQVKSNAEVLIDKYYLLIEANQYTYVHMCVRTTNNHVQALIVEVNWKSPVDKTDLRCRSIHHSFTHQVYAGCVVHAISS